MKGAIMKLSYASCAAIILALAAPAQARGREAGPVTLTWPDILAAIDGHPAMALASARTRHARAGADESPVGNPEISGSVGMGVSADGRERAVTWAIDVGIALDEIPTRIAMRRAALADAQVEQAKAAQIRSEVVAMLHEAFINASIRREIEVASREAAAAATELAEVAKSRHQAGEGRKIDVMRLEYDAEISKGRLSGAVLERQAAFGRLNRLLGSRLPESFDIDCDWAALPEIAGLDDLLAAGIDSNPAVRAANADARAGHAVLSAERARLVPGFRIGGFYERELDADKFGASLSMTIPLWDHNRKGINQAAARVAGARAEADLARLDYSDRLASAHARASISRETAIRYRDVVLPLAEQASAMAVALYKAGENGLVETIDARAACAQARMQMLDAFLEGWRAAIELQAITGVTP